MQGLAWMLIGLVLSLPAWGKNEVELRGQMRDSDLSFSRKVAVGSALWSFDAYRREQTTRAVVLRLARSDEVANDNGLIQEFDVQWTYWGIGGSATVHRCRADGCLVSFELVYTPRPRITQVATGGGFALDRVELGEPVAVEMQRQSVPWCTPLLLRLGEAELEFQVCAPGAD